MIELKLPVELTLETHRCYECGRWYGVERGYPGRFECPCCAGRKVASAFAERDQLEHVIRALRGAITRLRRRRG